MPITAEQAKTELRQRRAAEELARRKQLEPPDFGMIAVPRKELPGVWQYDKQLDKLLGDPDTDIEDFMPWDVRYDFGRIVGMTEKPDETKDRMKKSLYYSVQFGIPPKMTYDYLDFFMDRTKFDPLKAKPEERGFFGKVAESWRRGDAQIMADIGIYETAFEGMGDEEQALATLKKLQEKQALDPIEGNFLTELVYKGVEVVPGMARGYWEAIPQAFEGMAVGAGMALAAGQVPPLTLAPDEVVGVPAGAITGGKFGLMSGSAMFWYKQGAGSMYAAMRENDYNPELSKHIAGAAAVPYAIVEFMQVSRLTPGLRRGALNVAQKSMLKVVGNAAKKYGTVWSTEVFEEVVQEIIQIGAEDTAGFLSDKLKLPKGVSEFLIKRGQRVWETLKESGKAMALLPIPGGMIDIYTGKKALVPIEKKPEVEAKPGVVEIKAPEKDAVKEVAERFGISEERAKTILAKQAELRKEVAEKPPTEAIAAPERPVAPITPEEAVEVLRGQGYTKEQAEFIQQNRIDMIDRKSPTVQEVLDNLQDYPVLGETGKITVFRVSEKGKKLAAGKYVFDSKEKAVAFREEFGFIRGQPDIIEKVVDKSDLRKTQDAGEYIFFPEAVEVAEEGKKTISERLAGKKSTTIGTMTDTKDGRKIKMRLVPDTSEIGTYSIVISEGGRSQTIRMQYKSGMNMTDMIANFTDYMNTDEPGRFTVELSPMKAIPSKVKPAGFVAEKRQELKRLKDKRFKTANDEKQIKHIQKQLKENVEKWLPGQGIGWRVTAGQINRGMRIVEVYPETHEAKIQYITDVGVLADIKVGETHIVDMVDLVRDKKFDSVSAQPPAKAEAMTPEEFSQYEIPLVKDEAKFPQITRIKQILDKADIPIEEIGVTGSHAMGVATPESDIDIYVKVSDADFHKADDLLAPLSKEKIDAMVNWRGVGKEGGVLRGQKTYKRLVEQVKPPAKAEPAKLKSFGKPIKIDRGAIVDARKDVAIGDYVTGGVLDMERGVSVIHAGKVTKVLKQAVDIITPEGENLRLTNRIGVLSAEDAEIVKGLAKPIAKAEPAKVEKQPWEMTRAEFVKTVRGMAIPLSEMPLHRVEVEKAVKEGKPVSREVLEDYKSKPWAAEALKEPAKVEKAKAPKELLGGLAKEPPGLTKAEVEHLGRREQEALRAAQARGLKVGYKKGVAETVTDSRRSLDAFRMKEAISQKGKMDIANVILTYVPKEKQGDYIRRILEAKTQKRIERLTEAIDKYLDKYEKLQAIKGFKKFVKGIKKKYRRGEVALGYLPKKLSDKIIDVLDKFDLAKISEKKEETLESRLKYVTRISGELAEGFEQLNVDLDRDATDLLLMGTRRIEELKRLSQKYIGDLDVDEIRYIQASLEHLIKINDLKGKSKERRRIESLRTHINQARQEVLSPKKEVVELTGVLGAVRWLAVEGQSTIRTLVGLATGKDNVSSSHLLIEELDKANIKRKETYKDFIMHFRKLAERKGVKWDDIKDLNKFTKITIGGKEIEIDYDNLLSIYAHTQAEGNLRRLLITRGLNITTYKRDEHGIFTKKHTYRLKKPALSELRAISELIPEKHKKILDVYFKSNWEKQAPAINETSMAYQNFELARQEKYYHVSREIERVTEGRKADLSISIDQQSRALPRTGGNARINIKPFSHEVMDNMQWSAAYHAMTIPMENARTLAANIKWREAMKKAGQEKVLREIITMLRRTQGLIADQSVVELTASKLLGTVGKSILSLRFSGSLVQTASVPAAVEFIDKKYLSQIDVPTPAYIKSLKERSPVLWMRWEAKQFDYALGIVGAQNAFETLLFDHRATTDKFLFPYTAGDEIAIAKLSMAAERQIEAETKLKRGTDEFQQASFDLLYEAMNTQPQWDMIHRSPLTSDPSVLARSISMFMSARNAQRNVLVRAIDDYRKGRINISKLSERLAGVGMANMLVSVARHTFREVVKVAAITALVAMGIRKPPDDEEIKKEAERLAKKIPLETVFNLIGLDALGTLFTSMGYAALKTRKYGWGMGRYGDIRTGNMLADLTLDIMQMGIDFTLFTDQIISGEKYKSGKNRGRYKWEITGERLIGDIALLIAYRFGLPYEGIKSDIVWPIQSVFKETDSTTIRKTIKRSE